MLTLPILKKIIHQRPLPRALLLDISYYNSMIFILQYQDKGKL